MGFLIDHASEVRVGFFLGGLFIFVSLGLVFPYRTVTKKRDFFRWLHHVSLTVVNTAVLYLVAPISLVAFAANLGPAGFLGIQFSNSISSIILQVILLDLIVYFQHVIFHKVGVLWRLHRVHHSDLEFDATTALRFHTLEIGISFLIKAVAIWALGLHAAAVIVFEIVLNFSAMFNHSNFSLPKRLEVLNRLIVTPSMHRIHHSLGVHERDSNYGFFLSIWDRIFGSYQGCSQHDLRGGPIGTTEFRADQNLGRLLIQPFVGPVKKERETQIL